jgi:hypothetical protein
LAEALVNLVLESTQRIIAPPSESLSVGDEMFCVFLEGVLQGLKFLLLVDVVWLDAGETILLERSGNALVRLTEVCVPKVGRQDLHNWKQNYH